MGLEWIAIIIAAIIAVTGTRAQIVSDKRQQWIDGLREDVATLVELLHEAERNKAEVYKVGARVELRLNPNEKEHNNLLELLNTARSASYKDQAEYDSMANQIINTTKPILSTEWRRIKFESEFYWPFVSAYNRLKRAITYRKS